MKKLAICGLILPFFLILFSCSKEKGLNAIPDPPEGTYEIIAYNMDEQEVFRRKGEAQYIHLTDYGTQFRLDDPDFITQASANPDDVFATLILHGKQIIDSPVLLNDFNANMRQRWYSLDKDWSYSLQTGSLKIKEVARGKILGEFVIHLSKEQYINPKWGDAIVIKGKFYANCKYGC